MDYEGFENDVEEYRRRKEIEHNEMADCGAWVVLALFVVAFVCAIVDLIR